MPSFPPQERAETRFGAPTALLAIGALLVAIAARAWLADEAFLTLRTVDQWVHGNGLVWNPGVRVQVFTHPLWLLLLSIPYALVHDPYYGTLALCLAVDVGVAVVLFRDLVRDDGARLFALAALLGSQAFLDFGTSGLENPLAHVLVLLACREARDVRRAPERLFVPVGLLLVTRSDLVWLVLPLVVQGVAQLRTAPRPRPARALVALLGPFVAWTCFALVYYGSPLPNPAHAGLGHGLTPSALFTNGVGYLVSTLAFDATTLLAPALALVVGATSGDRRHRMLALGVALQLGYVVCLGGDFMRGRLLTTPFLVSVVLLAERLAASARASTGRATFGWAVAIVLVVAFRPELPDDGIDPRRVADERRHRATVTGIEHALGPRAMPDDAHVRNARTAERHRRLGHRRPVHTDVPGLMGFYAGRDVHLVDPYGLTDPVLARLPAEREARPRPGRFVRRMDDDHRAMLEDGFRGTPFRCRGEPVRCAVFRDARLVTSGPLTAPGRLGAIVRYALGAYDFAESAERYRRPTMPIVPIEEAGSPVAEGTPWNHPTVRRFHDHGIAFVTRGHRDARVLTLAVDANDRYAIRFERNASTIAEVSVGPRARTGLVHHRVMIPNAARGRFDRILLEPLDGDGGYAVADVHLE